MTPASHSEVVDWQTCRRKWWWAWQAGLAPVESSRPVKIGSAWAKLMETYYTALIFDANVWQLYRSMEPPLFGVGDHLDREDWVTLGGMLENWLTVYGPNGGWGKVLSVETDYTAGPSRNGPNLHLSGRPDLVAEDDAGKVWIVDSKTTTMAPSEWAHANGRKPQGLWYAWLVWRSTGRMPFGICYDVVKQAAPVKAEDVPVTKDGKRFYSVLPANLTAATFREAIMRCRFDEADYADKLAELDQRPEPLLHREFEVLDPARVVAIGNEIDGVLMEIRRARRETEIAHASYLPERSWPAYAVEVDRHYRAIVPRSMTACRTTGKRCPFEPVCLDGAAEADMVQLYKPRRHHNEEKQ